MALITEDHLEQQCLEWFKELGYAYAFAPDLAPDGITPERTDFRAPRNISTFQCFCGHEKAANRAA
jgi:hypothetical protein